MPVRPPGPAEGCRTHTPPTFQNCHSPHPRSPSPRGPGDDGKRVKVGYQPTGRTTSPAGLTLPAATRPEGPSRTKARSITPAGRNARTGRSARPPCAPAEPLRARIRRSGSAEASVEGSANGPRRAAVRSMCRSDGPSQQRGGDTTLASSAPTSSAVAACGGLAKLTAKLLDASLTSSAGINGSPAGDRPVASGATRSGRWHLVYPTLGAVGVGGGC